MKEDLDAMKNINSYNATRIKSRNFLTNISYNKVKEEDLIMKKKKKPKNKNKKKWKKENKENENEPKKLQQKIKNLN